MSFPLSNMIRVFLLKLALGKASEMPHNMEMKAKL